jgi:hypothetical protein
MPEVINMDDIPHRGHQEEDVPDTAIWDLIEPFDRQYSEMLRLLQKAWTHGDEEVLSESVGKMIQMGTTARAHILLKDDFRNGDCVSS